MRHNPRGRTRVLLVDDDPDSIQCVVAALSEVCVLRAVDSTAEALKILRSDPSIDLILLDTAPGEPSWQDFCRTVADDPTTKHTMVILLASTATMPPAVDTEAAVVDSMLRPLDEHRVRARVSTYLELMQHRNQLDQLVRRRSRELTGTCANLALCFARASEMGDMDTTPHLRRVSQYSRVLGRACGLDSGQCDNLALASVLHDVGKIGIPRHILLKPGELDDDERALVCDHTLIGSELLDHEDDEMLRVATTMARTHHEQWDGSGYPDGLAGAEIPLAGRICAICDVFDALTSPRPYKSPWTVQEAVDYLKANAGSRFDPDLVDLFLGHLDEIREIMVSHQSEVVV